MSEQIKVIVLNEEQQINPCFFVKGLKNGCHKLVPFESPLDDIDIPVLEIPASELKFLSDRLPGEICSVICRYIFWGMVKACDFIGAYRFMVGKRDLILHVADIFGVRGYLREDTKGKFKRSRNGQRVEYKMPYDKPGEMSEAWGDSNHDRIKGVLYLLEDIMDNHLTVPRDDNEYARGLIPTYAPLQRNLSGRYPSDFSSRSKSLHSHNQSVSELVFDDLTLGDATIFSRGPLNAHNVVLFGDKYQDGIYRCQSVKRGFVIFDRHDDDNCTMFAESAFECVECYESLPWKQFGVAARFAFGEDFGVYARAIGCMDETIPFSYRLVITEI